MGRNLINVKELTFLQKEGIFKGFIINIEEKKSKQGDPQDRLTISQELNSDETATIYLTYTEKALPFVKKAWRTIGAPVDSEVFEPQEYVNKPIMIKGEKINTDVLDDFGEPTGKKQTNYSYSIVENNTSVTNNVSTQKETVKNEDNINELIRNSAESSDTNVTENATENAKPTEDLEETTTELDLSSFLS